MTRTTAQRAADALARKDYDEAKKLYYRAQIEADSPARERHFREMWMLADYRQCKQSLLAQRG